ncbi:MAG: glycolate oxidase binding subunit [Actinomycetota bacterium]|jgi:glycolate oxidase FAD binding subunit|nr:glycolate oxidase binding subunit [Actinomycetota bacterium]
MDLNAGAIEGLAAAIAGAGSVVPVGARTHWEVGNPSGPGTEIAAPAGIMRYEPEDLTITVGAGTPFAALDAALAEYGQECALDPRDHRATIGGIVACGLSGIRRLRHGPLRDHVLEVRFVTGDGRLVKGGGQTVKNVTGYDLPRLLVGSFGTLGVLVQLTLRCRPRAETACWFRVDAPDDPLSAELYRAAAMLWDGATGHVLLEGAAADVDAQAVGLSAVDVPQLPGGPHRGRISVAPGELVGVGRALDELTGARWCAELGVGTVHVAGDDAAVVSGARTIAHAHRGWLLREAGAAGTDGFGCELPNLAVMRRVKDAFDPAGKLAPGRLPL